MQAREPETALRVANEFPAALYRLTDALTLSEAEHQLRYFEGPLEQEKNQLFEAENKGKSRSAKNRDGAAGDAGSTGCRRDRRSEATVGGAAGTTGRTGDRTNSENPQVVTLQSQIASLNAQIHTLEAQTGGAGTTAAQAKMPELALEVLRKQREVQYHETLFEIL